MVLLGMDLERDLLAAGEQVVRARPWPSIWSWRSPAG
jgi:hypothetical protein